MKTILHILTFMSLIWAVPAQAHFLTGAESRELHVLDGPDGTGTEIILRFPLTFAFAVALADRANASAPVEAPFLVTEFVSGVPFYRVDEVAMAADPAGFAGWILKDYRFSTEARVFSPEVEELALVMRSDVAKRSRGLTVAREMLAMGAAHPGSAHIADMEVVVRVLLRGAGASDALTIEVTTPPIPVPDTILFDTHVTDYRVQPPMLVSHEGFLPSPTTLKRDRWAALPHWIWQGIEHILFGLDHVLFVLCLVVAAPSFRGLVWSVTGFTLGHSITLSAGALGFAPTAGWFIPGVELGVALSIVAMAVLALVRRTGPMRFTLAAALGLLHGFGFAFMLKPMLGDAGAGLALPLAGFNLGVELGQLVIVGVAFALLWLIDKRLSALGTGLRITAAALAGLVAMTMVYERTGSVIAVLPPQAQSTQGG